MNDGTPLMELRNVGRVTKDLLIVNLEKYLTEALAQEIKEFAGVDRVAVYKVLGSGSDRRPLQPAVGTGPTDSDRAVPERTDFSTQREVDERLQKASTTPV